MSSPKDSWTKTHLSGRQDVTHDRRRVVNQPLQSRYRPYIVCIAAFALWTFSPLFLSEPTINNSSFAIRLSSFLGIKQHAGDTTLDRDEFRWGDIEPSPSLQYTPCFGTFQCARLSVPLNWNASTEEQAIGPRAAIAVIKLPAKVPVTDPRYGGPIVTNPGGPGESGVYQVLKEGRHIQTIVDSPEAPGDAATLTREVRHGEAAKNHKYFDILSFDPRGVNNTTPALRCFPDGFNQQAWMLGDLDYGLLWSSESIIGYEWAKASALGASCARDETDDGILRYANTAQVVEDMVEIIEKEGEWRAAEARRLLSDMKHIDDRVQDKVTKRTAHHSGEEKLQYWGMSYGTLIGSTFAALHPDKVGRLILDGVVDPADHYAGAWLTQLLDSDKVVAKFSEYCFQAGPDKCPLYTEPSPAAIEARFTSILLSLKTSPIPITLPRPSSESGKKNPGPEIITYGDAHLYMLSSIYFSFATAETFWDMVVALEERNTTSPALTDLASQKQARLEPAKGCTIEDDKNKIIPSLPRLPCVAPYNSMLGPNQAIGCMDIGGTPNVTQDSYRAYLEELTSQSRWVSPSWARNKLGCLGYGIEPAWRPTFSFQTAEWANTSHPLLVIGNTHDPVTPLRNARRVAAELFPGSVVLHQDSQGHCSPSNPSLCTARAVRRYFQTGELPTAGTVCEPEVRPFVGCVQDHGCAYESSEDRALWESMTAMADPFGLRREKRVDAKGLASVGNWNKVFERKNVLFP
ncbi:hypothetical protein PFICI_00226 [Pestalotiopsis fici W106-1]|uniref:Peptidase S33 tripeptidyl aminopeptidase-like C-terminal domain-containing protein n=1 Tax=Pestalotiopsis fici (strain W106-1 / CGMCC3.15140) TaxID=1229662 RepID=W3XK31_PESFW|nr:uncharacterized protein PFICI_00226 [Pestalotiopsis fici W106-1]ETS86398.1 hypothetical protein PFICI_00226 [Pestalotiopsis fici W106-1]